ncbi:PepSY domain-containing protein [Mucilaginibacter robiniae]|uniref:PepSY domain-containing protein n=1 Tax=Mucilaginibacter robiniae TaxID=2728022 RepID=A0A7L5E9V7_9SPHI|nr:PepSY-associated TM helix domain-containing protein [Mucilaginibacter robiniae]QJD97683.1 PepSY domain-containing protein [Mucilaginibacter robiniae]
MKRKITKWAFKFHGCLGLTAGFFFLLFGLTGSMLMFRSNMERHFNPELHHLTPASKQVSADQIYRMLVRTHPNLQKLVLHDFPQDKYDSYEFMLYKNQQHVTENYLYYVFVNPYTGKILKEGNYQDLSPFFMRWLYSFHYSLQLGIPGKLFTGMVGLVMVFSLITGTIVYRKHFWEAFRWQAGLKFKNRRTTVSTLHRIIGVWSVLFNFILFFTGFWLNRKEFTSVGWKLHPPHVNYVISANLDAVIAESKKVVKGFQPIAVNIPATQGDDIMVRGHMPQTTFFLLQGKPSSIFFNATTGRLTRIAPIEQQNFEKRSDWEVYQLHIGAYGGNWIKWLYLVLGLTPGVLSVTGALLWLKRNRKY